MLEPWNNASIQPPPILTSQPLVYIGKQAIILQIPKPISYTSIAILMILINLHFLETEDIAYIFREMSRILSSQTPLHKEGAILSRLLYKFDKKFRNDIGYRSFKKVNVALRRYLSLNLLNTVDTFRSVLPQPGEALPRLPTRQMLQHVLVRLITFAKVMQRTCVCSRRAGVLYLDRVRRGEGHWMSLVPYAALSRLANVTSLLLTHACTWYNNLHPFLDKLQPRGLPFLPENYQLPENLSEWLELNDLDELGRYDWKTNKCLDVGIIADVVEESDQFDIFKYISDINEPEEEESEMTAENLPQLKNEVRPPAVATLQNTDQGQVVSRDTLKVKEPEEKYLPKIFKEKTDSHNVSCVTNSQRLKQFLANEEKYRNDGSAAALSKHLSFMQWQALKCTLLKLANTLVKPQKLQRKFQKIWKDKCLDYC